MYRWRTRKLLNAKVYAKLRWPDLRHSMTEGVDERTSSKAPKALSVLFAMA
jgi:hypothetical protein